MEEIFYSLFISLAILLLTCWLVMCSIFLFRRKVQFIQKLYVMLFEKDDYKVYLEVKEYLKDHKVHLVPSIELSSMQVRKTLLTDKWIFTVFECTNNEIDVAVYDNRYRLCLTNFHNMLMQDLLNDAGYTREDIDRVAKEGKMQYQRLEQELAELAENYKELKALEEQLNKEKENND
jgi:hypothetical protein